MQADLKLCHIFNISSVGIQVSIWQAIHHYLKHSSVDSGNNGFGGRQDSGNNGFGGHQESGNHGITQPADHLHHFSKGVPMMNAESSDDDSDFS
jgi:hypothetical protein